MPGPLELPSIENLRCFLVAARHLNFRRAAQEVHLTPAAFGQRIKQLEETLGHQLFERTTRSMKLTAQGQRLIPAAQTTLREVMRCVEVIAPSEQMPMRITLGTRFELGISWLVPAVVAMKEAIPHLTIELYFGSGPDILGRLTAGLLDAVITSSAVARHDWATEFLHTEEYAFVGAPALLERVPFTCVEDAVRHVLLDIDERLPLTRYLSSVTPKPFEFQAVLRLGAAEAIRQMVLAGRGVSVLPLYMISKELEEGRLLPLLTHLTLLTDSFRLISPTHSPLEGGLRQIAEFLQQRPLT